MKTKDALVLAQRLIESSGRYKYVEVRLEVDTTSVRVNGKVIAMRSSKSVSFTVGINKAQHTNTGCEYSTLLKYLKMPVEDIPRILAQPFKYKSYEVGLRDLLEQRLSQCST